MIKLQKKRFAAHILMFNCEEFILLTLRNCGPFVGRIYVAYSEKPWTYNPDARLNFVNQTDKNILKLSEYYHKIEILEGVWEKEEDQRNACLDKAKADGFDYLIIQDADEFYSREDYKSNLYEIESNPDKDVYITPWCSFWKSLDYVIESKEGTIVIGTPEFAVNCKSETRFIRARTTNARSKHSLNGLCYHLSFVGSDVGVWRKINTWGHSHQFDRKKWFEQKWIKWTPSTRNLHPVEPAAWKKAIKFEGQLPDILQGVNNSFLSLYKFTISDWIEKYSENVRSIGQYVKWCFCKMLGPQKCVVLRKILNSFVTLVRFPYLIFCLLVKKLTGHHKLKSAITSKREIRLHLGCGDDHLPGYLNCDYRLTNAADVIMDCNSLRKFKNISVTEVFSHAFFEHLYKAQQLPFLIDCHRVLKENGYIFFLGIPDFEVIAQEYLDNADFKGEKGGFNLYQVYRYSHGDPEIAQDYWLEQLHKSLFDKKYLKDLLLTAGFSKIVLFNYCYPGEKIPLNLGFIGYKNAENISHQDIETIMARYDKYISDFKDVRLYLI